MQLDFYLIFYLLFIILNIFLFYSLMYCHAIWFLFDFFIYFLLF